MTVPRYPETLPGVSTFILTPTVQVLQSENEMGPVAGRRRTRQPGATAEVRFRFIATDYAVFVEWWKTELLYGHRWFLINLPSAGGITWHYVRFSDRYRATLNGHRNWEVQASLEIRDRQFAPAVPGDPLFAFNKIYASAKGGVLRDWSNFNQTLLYPSGSVSLEADVSSPSKTVPVFDATRTKYVGANTGASSLPGMAFGGADISLDMYVRVDSYSSSSQYFVFCNQSLSHGLWAYINGSGSGSRLAVYDFGTEGVVAGDFVPTLHQWFHLSIQLERTSPGASSGLVLIRVNGTLRETRVKTGVNPISWNQFHFGGTAGTSPGYYLHGATDLVRLTEGRRFLADFLPPTDLELA